MASNRTSTSHTQLLSVREVLQILNDYIISWSSQRSLLFCFILFCFNTFVGHSKLNCFGCWTQIQWVLKNRGNFFFVFALLKSIAHEHFLTILHIFLFISVYFIHDDLLRSNFLLLETRQKTKTKKKTRLSFSSVCFSLILNCKQNC